MPRARPSRSSSNSRRSSSPSQPRRPTSGKESLPSWRSGSPASKGVEMEATATTTSPQQHPIRLVVNDDLQRNRLTVFFRLILAIPLIFWFLLWAVIAMLAYIVNWFATLFMGQSPDGLHRFLATFLRFGTHVRAYCFLIADPYPG